MAKEKTYNNQKFWMQKKYRKLCRHTAIHETCLPIHTNTRILFILLIRTDTQNSLSVHTLRRGPDCRKIHIFKGWTEGFPPETVCGQTWEQVECICSLVGGGTQKFFFPIQKGLKLHLFFQAWVECIWKIDLSWNICSSFDQKSSTLRNVSQDRATP